MFISKYGVARHVYLPIVKRAVVDFAVGADWTPAAGDVKISKDGGAAANVTNLPVAIVMGNGAIWDFSLTATEMQAAQIVVTVVDAATKAVEDQSFIIQTHGNASALLQIDLADSVRAGLTALPNATAGANGGVPLGDASSRVDVGKWLGTAVTGATAGVPDVNVLRVNTTVQTARDLGLALPAAAPGAANGLLIAGTNAPVTITGSGNALTLNSTGANGAGLAIQGNGSGSGMTSIGGATGAGMFIQGGATSGDGWVVTSINGHGLNVSGTGTGKHGINAIGAAASGANPAGHGINAVGGAASTTAGGTVGVGFNMLGGAGAATNNGSGAGMVIAAGGTTTVNGNNGITITGSLNGSGISTTGAGTGDGIKGVAGATGVGIRGVLDDIVEGTFTLRQEARGWSAALLSKASGLATTTATYRDIADGKNRIVATVDSDGNRSAVTLDLT